ncbi:bifunctional pyr operon transcriptional regulator/uracil phosphoribosyltransferase PyrR [Wandonia haliotis]|uniref:Bifunctional pyr operon transcriptional regulator/uracil phosphoribosyltransferase PyrR n=2 Tax=Wandonia haliotis TaxID=574963 RepID=A0ABP3Y1A8_9FLAO
MHQEEIKFYICKVLNPMETQVILNSRHFDLTLKRLCHQLIENHGDFSGTVLIGLQPRGVNVVTRLKLLLEEILDKPVQCGSLDITFYRDDFRRRERPLIPSATNIDFVIEKKKVVLVDDVLFTGRTIRAGLDAMLAFGRPSGVELLAFIDRRFKRELPIQADYVGKAVDTLSEERVSVEWQEIEGEDKVVLFTPNKLNG